VDECKQAMDSDSQAGTVASSEVLRKYPTLPYEGAAKEESDRICDMFQQPHLDQEYIIPGTVTFKEN